MRSLNKILILFVFLIVLTSVILWEGLQSQWFASKLSVYATKYAKEILETDIRFSSINFKIYPPGAELQGVTVKGSDNDFEFETQVSSLGFYFNPFDVLDTEFRINRIVLEDGKLNFQSISDNKSDPGKKKNIRPTKIFKKIESLPLNQIYMKDMMVRVDGASFVVNRLNLLNGKSEVNVGGHVQDIDLSSFIPFDKRVDEFYFSGTVDPLRLEIKKGHIKKDLAIVKYSGEIESYLSDNISYNLELEASLPLKMVEDYVDIKEAGRLYEGNLALRGKLKGERENFSGTLNGIARNFKTDFAYGHELTASVDFNPKNIRLTQFHLRANEQEVKLNKPFELFNLNSKKWIEEPVFATAKNFRSDNFLSVLQGKVDFIDTTLSGDVKFVLEEEYFTFSLSENTRVHDLALRPKGEHVFHLKDFNLSKGEFRIEGDLFTLDGILQKNESFLPIKGRFNKDDLLLTMTQGRLDLSEIDPLLTFKMGGLADLSFQLYEEADLKLDVLIDAQKMIFDNYYFDTLTTELEVNLDEDTLEFDSLKAQVDRMLVSSQGIVRYGESKVLADFQATDIHLGALKKMLLKDHSKIIFDENDIFGSWEAGGSVSGGISLDTMNLRGFLNGSNNFIYGENVEDIKMSFMLQDNIVKVRDFVGSKASGEITANLDYDIGLDKLELSSNYKDIPLNEISLYSKVPLNLQGQLSGELTATNFKDAWSASGEAKISDASVLSERFEDSILQYSLSDEILKLDFNGMKDQVKISSALSLSSSRELSTLNVDLDIPVLRKVFGIFTGVDILDSSLEGSVKYSADLRFYLSPFKVHDLRTNLKELTVKKGVIDVDYNNPKPEIVVESGLVQKWDTNVRGKNFYIISEGGGDLRENHRILTNVKVDASLLEIFSEFIPKANGNLRGKFLYESSFFGNKYEALVTSNNLSLSSNLLPTAITQTNMQLSFAKNRLNIDKFRAELISGVLELDGGVNFDSVLPEVNVGYVFRDTGISVMKKSNVIFSGNGSLVGKGFPYLLSGDIYIQRFIVINEITDFTSGGAPVFAEDIKYLPGRDEINIDNLIELNLNIVTREPIFVKNSMIDIGFIGGVQVVGNEKDPRLVGKFSLAPRNNRVSFKNNNFVLSKGNVFFDQDDPITNPDLDFLATTSINDYKIFAKLIGEVKNFDFTFSSEPALAQSDILSLVAFGYTDDISSNLTDSEKESLTRASVGSILFDSFKINETLKNEFGLQVNLGTQIMRDEESLLSQRNAESNIQSAGVTSATTFEVKKQLSDAMSLSVSSSVGDSRVQRQGVNLNYNVDKKVSIEGIYETINTNDNQVINNTNSFGADVKVRWTFK